MKNIYACIILLFSITTCAQNIAIRGVIKDAVSKEPIIAASVGVQNSGLGTITNEEGVFQLSAPKSGTIIISYLGYKTKYIPGFDFKEDKIILLEQSEEVLEEVMVTKIPLPILMLPL